MYKGDKVLLAHPGVSLPPKEPVDKKKEGAFDNRAGRSMSGNSVPFVRNYKKYPGKPGENGEESPLFPPEIPENEV